MWSFIKICLICIIDIYRLKEKFHRKTRNITTPCHVAAVKIWAHFDLLKQQSTIKISSPLFSIFSLAAILVGSRDHRTQFWKGAIQGPFHHSLVQIGPVASEELIKMWKVNGRTDDGHSVVTIAKKTGSEIKPSITQLFNICLWKVKALRYI